MSTDRVKIIAEFRRSQPIVELERKWGKAKGRHSNRYWAQEWIDLAFARARILHKKLVMCCSAEDAEIGKHSATSDSGREG